LPAILSQAAEAGIIFGNGMRCGMAKGSVYIYAGDGRGKSPAALGRALQAAMEGRNVVIIQFLKGSGSRNSDFLRRMEPEIKLFTFEKSDENYEDLSEDKKKEEIANIKNGMNFARKVLARVRSADPGRNAEADGKGDRTCGRAESNVGVP
jgi:ATP:corrinoid adenosyltransferase